MLRILSAVAILAALGGAAEAQDRPLRVRDVRPTKLERGDKMVVEAFAYVPGARTEVKVTIAGRAPVTLAGRAVTADRVLVDVDSVFENAFGTDWIKGPATVEVTQVFGDRRVVHQAPAAPFALEIFPRSFRSAATRIVDRHEQGRVLGWLGLELNEVPVASAPGQPARNVVQVGRVREAFKVGDFMTRYDRVPIDAVITREELTRDELNPNQLLAFFNWLDHDKDGRVTRHEAEEKETDAGPAALAGIRPGDVVQTANGRPVASIGDFLLAWQDQGDQVSVGLLRGGQPIVTSLPLHGIPASIPSGFLLAGFLIAACLVIIGLVGPGSGFIVVWERKVSGMMQSRIGPNRVGPNGWLQWLADAIKLITKEDIVPREADRILFTIAPYFAFMGLLLTFIVLPFSEKLIIADLDIGILFLASVTSLVVVSIIMGGWASNSKWSLLGGMRSAAQIISYELPASVALLTVATMTGSLSTQDVIRSQGGLPWQWNVFANPFTFACFFIYFISALAEGNRTPFDLPEAESELVSGYNTEYSGFRFGIYPMVEWVNLYVISAIATTMFLGGWNVPFVSPDRIAGSLGLQILSLGMFFAKAVTLIFVIIWIRWTLPRFRVDQMMNMCWKYFIPISFGCFLGITLWVWLVPPALQQVMAVLMFLVFGVGLGVHFVRRVRFAYKTTGRLQTNTFQ